MSPFTTALIADVLLKATLGLGLAAAAGRSRSGAPPPPRATWCGRSAC